MKVGMRGNCMKQKIGKRLHRDREEIIGFCSNCQKVHLYGTGYVAKLMIQYLEEENIVVEDVIVSDGYKSLDMFLGKYPVIELSNVFLEKTDGIILCVKNAAVREIVEALEEKEIPISQIYRQTIWENSDFERWVYSSRIKDAYDFGGSGYFEDCVELDKLGIENGTDKSSKMHNYLKKYEFFLSKWRNAQFNLLELGVETGASITMWSDYFKSAMIYGVDINENCKENEKNNCKIIIGDLGNEEFLDVLGELEPTVIVDDASHLWSHQIKAIYHLLPKLKAGGIYILEDLGTSFSSYRHCCFDDAIISAYDFLSAIAEVVCSREYLRKMRLQPELILFEKEIEEMAMQIEMITFIHESCIIVKK